MSELTQTERQLVYLISCSINQTLPREDVLKCAELNRLFCAARSHSVASMVCMALEKTSVFAAADTANQRQWLDAKNKAIRKNMLLDIEREAIEKQLETAGIWYMPLKGSILKDWYPKPGMREMADSDILFDPSRRRDVRHIFLDRGYKVESYADGNHDVYKKPPVYNFEMHIALFHEAMNAEFAEYFSNVKDRLAHPENGGHCFAFTPEDFYIFFVAHAYKHYSYGGTGIRTLADVFIVNEHMKNCVDWAFIEQKTRQLGIFDFEEKSRILSEKLFAAAKPLTEITLTEDDERMLSYCLGATTYGTLCNQVGNHLRDIQDGSAKPLFYAKVRYCVERIFPGRSFCKMSHPFIYMHPWLLPAFWIWRIVSKVCVNGRKICKELSVLAAYKPKEMEGQEKTESETNA